MAEESQAPAADQPSGAPSSSAAEGAAAEGGGSMPLIIGGVVLLALLGGVGAFLALSGKSDSTSTTASSAANPSNGGNIVGTTPPPTGQPPPDGGMTYYGIKIGELADAKEAATAAKGTVYAAAEKQIYIVGFNYDGSKGDTIFFAGTTDTVGESGDQIPDEKKGTEKLANYENKNILLNLDNSIKGYKYFGVFDRTKKESYGHVTITAEMVPHEMELKTGLEPPDPRVQSKGVKIENSRVLTVVEMQYSKQADPADINFAAGKGEIKKDGAFRLALGNLEGLTKQDKTLTLPEGKSWDQFEWVALLDFNSDASLGSVTLPKPDELKVPIYQVPSSRRLRGVKRRGRSGHQILKAEKSKPKVLVCTFGESGVTSAMVPADGMCDVMFYTDMQYDSDKDTIVPRDGGPAFSVLKSAASKYIKTSFGTSMSTGSIAEAVKDKQSELTESLDELFRARLVHFGMLNVENAEDYDDLKGADLQYLKVVSDFLKTKSSKRQHQCALGISLRDGSKGDKILDVAKRAPRDFPGLTMVIIKLHTESAGNGDRWPLAPNPDGADLSEHNALSLALIRDDLKNELTDIARRGRYAMLSFAMYARTYHMKKTWNQASAREMSESTLNMDYAAVCKMKTEKDVTDEETVYAADEHKKFLALFDSAVTFTSKTKARLSVMPKDYTGLAVYNVEMDDYKDTCGKGKFARLKAIKAALGA